MKTRLLKKLRKQVKKDYTVCMDNCGEGYLIYSRPLERERHIHDDELIIPRWFKTLEEALCALHKIRNYHILRMIKYRRKEILQKKIWKIDKELEKY